MDRIRFLEYRKQVIIGANDLKVGDYYYLDGSWSDGEYRKYVDGGIELLPVKPVSRRNVIGIVYWTGDATKKDITLKAHRPNCTRGLVVSLKEDADIAWQTNSSVVQLWLNNKHYGKFSPAMTDRNVGDPMHNIQVYNNTKAIELFNSVSENKNNTVNVVQKVVDYLGMFLLRQLVVVGILLR